MELHARLTDPLAAKLRAAAAASHPPPPHNDSWVHSLLLRDGRALNRIAVPWCLVMSATLAWCVPTLVTGRDRHALDLSRYASAFGLVLTTLSFLLVFRLNRSAERFWAARALWGKLVEVCRQLCCGAVTHLPHAPACRDAVCAWACAFAALSKRRMRGPSGDDGQQLAALLPPDCAAAAAASPHPPLFAANGARAALRAALGPAAVLRACAPQRQPPAAAAPGGDDAARLLLAHAAVAGPHYAAVLRTLETHVDELVGCVGGLERVRGTPLPVVYVSHLRTFLIGYLMLIPLVFLSSWRWGTVPAMALVSFALLGVEGAASECERPFDDKVNHLAQSAFVAVVAADVAELLRAAGVHCTQLAAAAQWGGDGPATPSPAAPGPAADGAEEAV